MTKKKKRILMILGVVLAVIVILCLLYFWAIWSFLSWKTIDLQTFEGPNGEKWIIKQEGWMRWIRVTFYLKEGWFGKQTLDTFDKEGNRSDFSVTWGESTVTITETGGLARTLTYPLS